MSFKSSLKLLARRAGHRWTFLFVTAMAASCLCPTIQGSNERPSADELFVRGLRTRRLFELAETHCLRRLEDSQLSAWDRGSLTLELIQTYAQHAANSSSERRPVLWKQGEEVANRFLNTRPKDPQQLLVKTQQALLFLTRGELARLESEVAADPTAALTEAREEIRVAAKKLEQIDQELDATIPIRLRDKPADQLTADELTSLQYHVRYERARAAHLQALSYATGSPDRLAALNQATELLAEPLRETNAEQELGSKVRLELAICQRLLRDYSAAELAVKELDADRVPVDLRLAARAEAVRIALATNRSPDALRILALGRAMNGQVSPELDFAHLETYVALWQQAADKKQEIEAQKWRNEAINTVKGIEQTHGSYWGRRAEILLVSIGGERSGGSVEILRRAADDFYLKGNLDEAIATYDKASAAASSANDTKSAFESSYKSALIEQGRQNYLKASIRFQRLALSFKDHPQAANAHLLAIVNAAQVWKAEPSHRNQYIGLLEEHLGSWAASATADSARLWLGAVHEQERSWSSAIAAYCSVDRKSKQAVPAIEGAARCWSEWFRARKAAGENVETAALDAVKWLEAGFIENGGLPASWSEAQRSMLVAAAHLRLEWAGTERKMIEQQLRHALDAPPPPSPEWLTSARVLLLLAIADQPGRGGEVKQLLAELRSSKPDRLLPIAVQLDAMQKAAGSSSRAELARLELNVLDQLPGDITARPLELQLRITRLRSSALLGMGDPKGAIREFEKLVIQQPQNGDLQAEFGDLLLSSPEAADWRRALEQWRIVVSRSEPRSKRWFRAKYSVALTQLKLGNKSEAAKLVQYLQATEDLSRSGLEKEFLDLLQKSQ